MTSADAGPSNLMVADMRNTAGLWEASCRAESVEPGKAWNTAADRYSRGFADPQLLREASKDVA